MAAIERGGIEHQKSPLQTKSARLWEYTFSRLWRVVSRTDRVTGKWRADFLVAIPGVFWSICFSSLREKDRALFHV
jgi:hypothetical protein